MCCGRVGTKVIEASDSKKRREKRKRDCGIENETNKTQSKRTKKSKEQAARVRSNEE